MAGSHRSSAFTDLGDIARRLAAHLTGRYRLDGELGRGGMALVYRAHDLRHDRPVALKVLRPDLAAGLSADRFLREIRVAARLQHPHILPLLDSGDVPGEVAAPPLLWFTMPLVEGESLRDRLRRGGAQSLDDTTRWVRQLAEALAYAHARGVIHRDIKPENVLVTNGHALLADFGVARAVESEGSERLTETGLALGTPAYMSPEQAAADPALDGRSDLYSLGCVCFELLAGEPPYTGPTVQSIVAKRLMDPVPSVRRLRETVPPGLDQVVQRLLAKVPADRYPSAEALLAALDAPLSPAPSPPSPPSRWRRVALAGVAVLIVVGLGALAAVTRLRAHPQPAVDPAAVAVLPFRVTGPDRSLDYLGEGIVDLLAVKLAGAADIHPVPTRQVLSYLGFHPGMDVSAEAGAAAARRAGAGLVLDGSIVRSGSGVQLSAALHRSDGSGRPVEATAAGPVDSFPALVDQVAAQLLAGHGGTRTAALGELSSARAIAQYLQGKSAHRIGRYRDAVSHFMAALDDDSTFALAALDLIASANRTNQADAGDRAVRLAWTYRDKLSPKGRALLRAWLGPNYPAPSSLVLVLAAWEDAVRTAPDVADAWFELGDQELHYGLLNDVPQAVRRAEGHFSRALELDSAFMMPLDHLLSAKMYLEDTTDLRALARLWSARDTASGERSDYMRWRLALTLGDSAAVARERGRMERWDDASLTWLASDAQAEGAGVGDVRLALDELAHRAVTGRRLRDARLWRRDWLLNAGRPAAALAVTDSMEADEPWPGWARQQRIDDAIYEDGDTAAAAADARALSAAKLRPGAGDPTARAVAARSACRLGLWSLSRGDSAGVRAWWARTQDHLADQPVYQDDDRAICADLLEAWLAWREGRPVYRALLDRADSTLIASNLASEWQVTLVTARLREATGDVAGARRAVGRVLVTMPVSPMYIATYLREQGRLALLTGDTASAILALRRYLALRADPEPSLRPEVDRERDRLASLVGR